MLRNTAIALVSTALLAAPLPGADPGDVAGTGSASIQVTPETARVTTFYDGAKLEVTGRAPDGMALAVLLTGAEAPLHLKKKGKVWGILWMNVDEVGFDHVPSAYLLASSGSLGALAPSEERARAGVGLDVLDDARGGDAGDDGAALFAELVKLKEREHLWSTFENAVDVRPAGAGVVAFSTTLPLPARIPEGSYRVTLWGFQGGKGEALATTEVAVRAVGLMRDIAVLARTHGTLYGFLALFIALVVGLATGLVFGLAGKAH